MTAVTGNTYPVKEALKALGARWNPDQKVWMVPDEKIEQARAIVASAPAKTSQNSDYRPSRCKQCGASASRYNKVYRSGICRECYSEEEDGYSY